MGFRSPNYQYLVTSFWDDISQTMLSSDNTFYEDPQYCAPQKSSGAISEDAIRSIKEEILEKVIVLLTYESSIMNYFALDYEQT